MKKIFLLLVTAFCIVGCGQKQQTVSRDQLVSGFVTPPDSITTSVYWYWISNNISKEGVIKDLESMKQAGINRAYIGNIGLDGVPYGNVPMFTDEWWEILHTALKKAGELDIEIGIFNSPGWSQSGGPWIDSTQAMRYVTASEVDVTGPVKFSQKLKTPKPEFQDIRVIAYQTPKDKGVRLTHKTAKITAPGIPNPSVLLDEDTATKVRIPVDKITEFTIEANEPFTTRSLTLWTGRNNLVADCKLEAFVDGNWQLLTDIEIYRTSNILTVGFDQSSPVIASFPAVTASRYRLTIDNKPNKLILLELEDTHKTSMLGEIELSSAAKVARYKEKTLAKMFTEPLPMWKEYQWAKQPEVGEPEYVITPDKVLDITAYMDADGTLNWDVPEGNWTIMRTGMAPTGTVNSPASPESTGYEVDKMSKEHVRYHFDSYMGEVLRRIPAEDRRTFKVVVQDSYETGGQNITDGFLEEFRDRYGYDPLPFLPVYDGYVVESQESSDRFLWDMRRMVADKVAYDYVAGLTEVSHEHGLTTWLENYGHWGFPGEFLMYGGQADEIGGEFWAEGGLGDIENRAAISAGHIYGKNKIYAESFTSAYGDFERHPAQFKYRGDRFFAEGINSTLLHVMISQPYDSVPGVNAWFGIEFNRGNTWFTHMDVFTTYLKRSNYMLQQGLNVADVAYFIGEDAPKMTGVQDPPLPPGYQFDYINAEVIEKYAKVKDGKITLPHGTQYRILVLPQLETMRPELLAKIKQLVKDGAVVLGPAPVRSPSLQNQPQADERIKSMTAELWAGIDGTTKENKYGKGLVLDGMTLEEAMARIDCIADCALPAGTDFMYGHRTLGDQEIYYVTNQTTETKTVSPVFRVTGKQPELWHPVTGEIRDLPAFAMDNRTTTVPLELAPHESVFVVFSRPAGTAKDTDVRINYPTPQLITELAVDWTVQFDPAMRGPINPVKLDRLQPWNTSSEDSIKYYSGGAVYRNTFTLDAQPEGGNIKVDLGKVEVMGKVWINGQYVGGVWTYPYVLDITKYVSVGSNELQVEVVNTWVNRLTGDSMLPENDRGTWTVRHPYTPTSELQASGLIGPVRIESIRY